MRTRLGIGKGMMMVRKIISTSCRNSLQLMIRQAATEMAT